MQEITLTLPFDPNVFLFQQKLKWQFFFKKKYSNYIYFYGTISVILFFFLIDLLSGNEKPYNPTFFGITLFLLLFNILTPWTSIYKSRRKYFETVTKTAILYKNEKPNSTYVLNNEGITYEDPERIYKLKWSLFKPFYMHKDTIVLTTKDNDTIFLMLSKTEVDNEQFENIYELLKRSIGLRVKA